jgi:hypothetical protein
LQITCVVSLLGALEQLVLLGTWRCGGGFLAHLFGICRETIAHLSVRGRRERNQAFSSPI